MSVFYNVLMEKSAQRQEREEDKSLIRSLSTDDLLGAVEGGGGGYIAGDTFYRPKSDKNFYRKKNMGRGVGIAVGVPLGIVGNRALGRGISRVIDRSAEEGSPIAPGLAATGGVLIGHALDKARAQREYDARKLTRETKAKPIRDELDLVGKRISDIAALREHSVGGDYAELSDTLDRKQRELLEQLEPYINSGDKPQRLYRGKLVGGLAGAGLGYGAKKLFDRYNAKKRSEQR